MDLFADAGEHVERLARSGGGVAHAIGGDERNAEAARAFDERLVARLLLAVEVPLERGVDVARAEYADGAAKAHRVVDQAHEARSELFELLRRGGALSLGRTQLHPCNEAAEVLVALPGFGEQRVDRAVGGSDLGADVRAQTELFGGHVEARRAIEPVAVDERHGGHVQGGRAGGQFLGLGGPAEEAEGGTGAHFDVAGGH